MSVAITNASHCVELCRRVREKHALDDTGGGGSGAQT
jgi:hypothetical protein